MNNSGFNLEVIDPFKKYKGLEGLYIIEHYIRDKRSNSGCPSYSDLSDALSTMNTLNLWDDYRIGYVTDSGYPSFYIDLWKERDWLKWKH